MTQIKRFIRTLAAAALLLLGSGMARSQTAKIAPDLAWRDANAMVDVIVRFHARPGEAQHERMRLHHARVKSLLDATRSAAYRLPAGELASLADDPDVEYIAPDRPVHGLLDLAGQAIQLGAAKSLGLSGAGIGVAVIDSGIALDPDMNDSRVVYQESFLGDKSPVDQYGHGTHVAGIVGGTGKKSAGGYAGMAPGVSLVNLRVLDQNGAGADSGVIAAIQRAIELKSKYNIRIINLSLGRGVFESYTLDPLCQAVEAAWKAGIVVVAAAGNDGRNNNAGTHGYGTIAAPGNDPLVITVGAMKTMGTGSRADDAIASYSSKGPTAIDHIVKPDLVAPGNRVISLLDPNSTLASQFPGNIQSNFYFQLSGTSTATPMVSGAAALLLQAHPALTPDQLKARLMKTAYKNFPVSSVAADPVTGMTYLSYYDVFTVGAGYLDIAAALANQDVAAGSAASPTAVYVPGTQSVIMVATCAPAGSQVIWGDQVIWGWQVIWSNQVIWGSQVIWGDQVIWGSQVIWGDQVIWGNATAMNALWSRTAAAFTSQTSAESAGIAINGDK